VERVAAPLSRFDGHVHAGSVVPPPVFAQGQQYTWSPVAVRMGIVEQPRVESGTSVDCRHVSE
jgi:hypothetical protein